MLAAELRSSLRLPGSEDSVALFNRRDHVASAGEALADLAETTFTVAEEDVRR
jgi:hypothetical protein